MSNEEFNWKYELPANHGLDEWDQFVNVSSGPAPMVGDTVHLRDRHFTVASRTLWHRLGRTYAGPAVITFKLERTAE